MRGLLLAVAVAACGAPARHAEALHPDVHAVEHERTRAVDVDDAVEPVEVEEPLPNKYLLARPQIRVRSLFPEELTWPLTVAPSSDPHYTPGAPWNAICERRGRMSPAALEYVLAWCAFRADGSYDLLAALAALRTSEPTLAEAVRHDIAYLLAATRVGNEVPAWLSAHHADVRMKDLVVAMLAEDNRLDEAISVDASIPRDGAPGTTCPRELRLAMMLPLERYPLVRLTDPAFKGSPCGARAFAVDKELADRRTDLIDTPPAARLLRAYHLWSSAGRNIERWIQIAELAESALALRETERFALTALDNAVRSSCSRETVFAVKVAASRLRVSPNHLEIHDDAIAELAALTPERCRTR